MPKFAGFFVGPEAWWLLMYGLLLVLIRIMHAPVKSADSLWISMAYIVPLIILPLSFSLYFVPGAWKSWLLLRLWMAGLIGCHVVLNKALSAHTEQGPGVGTAYIMGMGFAFIALIAGSIVVAIKMR